MRGLVASFVGCLLFFTAAADFARAGSIEPFHRRIEIRRDTAGEAQAMLIRARLTGIFGSVIDHFRHELAEYRAGGSPGLVGARFVEAEALIADDDASFGPSRAELKRVAHEAVDAILRTGFDAWLAAPAFRDLAIDYEKALRDIAERLDTVAALREPTYFFRGAVGKQAIDWALARAQARLGVSPAATVAVYLFERALDDLLLRQTFFQAFALHFLENASPAELKLSPAEIALAKSSIYEAKIRWNDVLASGEAAMTWRTYGDRSHARARKVAEDRMAHQSGAWNRIDFAFFGSNGVILNGLDAAARGSAKPSIALDAAHPTANLRARLVSELLILGARLSAAPAPVRSRWEGGVLSRYHEQRKTEGALLAHFESQGDRAQGRLILVQSVNPFLMRTE